jgi:protein SCO1/2
MSVAKLLIIAAFLLAMTFPGLAHEGTRHGNVDKLSGPADNYVYQLAEPGTYRLPEIKPAAGGMVLDERSRPHELKYLLRKHLTILAFIYTRCGDLCPLATMRMAQLKDQAERSAVGDLRLITMSFDPDHDTPERMAEFAEAWRGPEAVSGVSWLFLTAPSRQAIKPLLSAYGQPLAPRTEERDGSGSISHLMRVFLIDDHGVVRNIYSPDFLDPRLLLNDLLTLELERNKRGALPSSHLEN